MGETYENALISFKNSITSDPYAPLSTNWSQNASVCSWIGVSCGLKHRRVTALNLRDYDLAGTVAPHLGNLSFLRYLDISSNSFTGMLPFELSKLRLLKVMNVGANSFTGEISTCGNIPREIGRLRMLTELYLGYINGYQGGVPAEIGNLSRLERLNIDNASLTGDIPSSIFNMSSLTYLSLSNNSLLGSILTLLNTPKLETLYLDHNKLTVCQVLSDTTLIHERPMDDETEMHEPMQLDISTSAGDEESDQRGRSKSRATKKERPRRNAPRPAKYRDFVQY
ncbi:receptor kinase-like protein Xa21 [Salvia hispanica]|uniref:receptor kinase-like protein Xa21 n=1 Tax=Salvia hispanica TaxID=49212 RepID=UPI00200908E9|nr:receptor kinase-like protein Xa21 [Salvia hispanica]